MHFPPSDRKKSNPSHEFAGDRKNLLTFPHFDDIETSLRPTDRMTYFPHFAFNLSKVIFAVYSYFLLVGFCPFCLFVLHFLAPIF